MKIIVLTSGGVDSSTCLALAVDKYGYNNVISLSMYYGQRHEKELQAAKEISEYYGVEHIVVDLTAIFKYSNSSLLKSSDLPIPEGSYSQQQNDYNEKPVSTYVPFRNGLFLACAASIALSRGCEIIYYGAHSDDIAENAYPDCSKAFDDAMDLAIKEGSGNQLHIEAPFVSLNKSDVVKKGLSLKVPYELTWSCYQGGEKPCGKCATCIDRAKAFKLNGVKDPAL